MDLSLVFIKRQLKRAKLFEIQKLIRQIRMLNNRKGTDVQLQKSQRKATRFSEVLEALKELNVGCVADEVYQTLQKRGFLPSPDVIGVKGSTLSCTERARQRLITNKTFLRNISAKTDEGNGVQRAAILVDTLEDVSRHQTTECSTAYSGETVTAMEGLSSDSSSSGDDAQKEEEEEEEENEQQTDSDSDTSVSFVGNVGTTTSETKTVVIKRRENDSRRLKVSSDDKSVRDPLLESTFVATLSENSSTAHLKKSGVVQSSKQQRVNRPGQRARQRQWEKVYGVKAKHVQEKSKKSKARGKTGSRNIQQKSRPMSSTKSCSLHSSKAQLHPSWEAQRQRKARETGIPEFQGQRTVFSD